MPKASSSPIRFFLVLLAAASFASLSPAAQTVYTAVDVPPGTPATAFPAPREEWFQRVQDKFNKTQGKHFDIIFDGDSIIAGWEWPERGLPIWTERYAKLNPANFGIAGDEVQNVLWRLKQGQLDGMDPKLVVLMVGTNNVPWSPPDKIAEGVQVLVDEYLQDAPHAHLLLMAVTPRGIAADDPIRAKITKLNSLIAGFADGKRVSYLDLGPSFLNADGSQIAGLFGPDSVHPTPKGYQVWADAMQPEIDKIFPPAH